MGDGGNAGEQYLPAAIEALRSFPLDPEEPELVAISENVTFRVVDRRDGQAYVLRLHRPGYHDLAALISERIWLRALAEAGISVPSPVRAGDGRDYVPVRIDARNEIRHVGLSRWTEGEVVAEVMARVSDVGELGGHYSQLGTIMATMHDQASRWTPPTGFVRHRLDADGLLGEAPFWGRFWDHPGLTAVERKLLDDTRRRIHDVLTSRTGILHARASSTFSMIHADLHHANLLVSGDRLTVIDFDDAGFGWHHYDIAVALHDTHPTESTAALERIFLESYRHTRELTDEDVALIPLFRLVRSMAVIGWKHQRPEVPWPAGRFEAIKNDALVRCSLLVDGAPVLDEPT